MVYQQEHYQYNVANPELTQWSQEVPTSRKLLPDQTLPINKSGSALQPSPFSSSTLSFIEETSYDCAYYSLHAQKKVKERVKQFFPPPAHFASNDATIQFLSSLFECTFRIRERFERLTRGGSSVVTPCPQRKNEIE